MLLFNNNCVLNNSSVLCLLRQANNLLVQVELPPSDLGATALLNKSLQLLQEILSSHDSSCVTPEERKQAVAQVKIVCRCRADHLLNIGLIISQKIFNMFVLSCIMLFCSIYWAHSMGP